MQRAIELRRRLTYEDYAAIDDGIRHELIDGVIYDMAAPNDPHQAIVGELLRQLSNYLRGKGCVVRVSPYDVVLNEHNTVQPDLLVVCDRSKIRHAGCFGAPDLVVEILSRSSATHDCIRKYNLYHDTGVREYWIVSPEEHMIQVCLLDNGFYRTHSVYLKDKTLKVNVLDECEIDLEAVFSDGDEFANIKDPDWDDE